MYIDNFPNFNIDISNAIKLTKQSILNKKLLCSLHSIFKEDELSILSLEGIEEISKCYNFTAIFFSDKPYLDIEKAIGTNISILINTSKEPRYIHGIISKFSRCFSGKDNNMEIAYYMAEIKPKLWTLSLNKDCRIFQNKSALDIIKIILQESKITDIQYRIGNCGKSEREYCVQYNESNLAFISRLMEEEGIFYFFQHEKNRHTLILADAASAYGQDEILNETVYYPYLNRQFTDCVFDIKKTAILGTDCFATSDYNFEISQTNLFNKIKGKSANYETYEYPGFYKKLNEGKNISDIRIQEIESNKQIINGSSTLPNFVSGYKFKLQNHPDSNLNSEFLLCKIYHKLSFLETDDNVYKNQFWSIPSSTEFRPERVNTKPKILGTQTAVVTGPSGEEIYRDKFGRVKIHFYWDRYDKLDENSSCWVRVAQIWAGNSWGGLYTPRIGHEVVVSFEGGDPDRPLIVGCVYNDQYMPPYSDQEATKSTIKSSTSKGEDGFNEIRFDDLKGQEEFYIHAQKDMNIDIINKRSTLIEESDDYLTISKGSRNISLNAEGDNKANLTTILKKGDINTEIKEGNLNTVLNKGNLTTNLEKGNLLRILSNGNYEEKLKNGNKTLDIKGDYKIKVDGNLSIEVSGDITLKANKSINIEGLDISQKAKTNFAIDAGTNLIAKGKISLTAEAGVAFTAKGTNVTVQGTAATTVNGTNVTVQGNGSCAVTSPSITLGGGAIILG